MLRRAAHWHRPLMVFVSAMAVLAVGCAVGVATDPRVLTGVPIWWKPLKFAVSFVLCSNHERARNLMRASLVYLPTLLMFMMLDLV